MKSALRYAICAFLPVVFSLPAYAACTETPITVTATICAASAPATLESVKIDQAAPAPPPPPVLAPAFYVAPSGSDSNPGTLASPFATIARCQTAMRASGTQKTCYVRAGTYAYSTSAPGCFGNSFAINMTTADNGETLSFYPPDGYGSAKITGGGTADSGICLAGSGITVEGLDVGQFKRFAIASANSNNKIKNNIAHDTTMVNSNGTIFLNGNVQGNLVSHNYVYNSANNGIEAHPGSAGQLNGVEISYNFVYNSTMNCTDCGAIYTQDVFFSTGSATTIKNNYVRDIAANTGRPNSKGIYLDDGASGHIVTGNVVQPGAKGWACFQIHGGQNNTLTGNICDEGGASVPGGIVYYQTSGGGAAMAGNVFVNNLVLTATGNAGGGYYPDGVPGNKLTVRNNNYFGYGSVTPARTGAAAVGGGDSAPANVNPNFTCGWTYTLPSNSPVYSAPTLFPMQPAGWGTPGFWGPPGFVVPQAGTPPSPSHTC